MRTEIKIKLLRVDPDRPTMLISDRATGEEFAEYRLLPGEEKKEICAMRRTILRHLLGGGAFGNYQW